MPDRFLTIEDATVSYGEETVRSTALRKVSLSFEPGSLTLVTGPSGSGKTTLLSLLGCLLTPDHGAVFVQGTEVARLSEAARTVVRRRNIGFIFQAFRLFRSLSALDNVTLASELDGRNGSSRQAAKKLLDRLGLAEKIHVKPRFLSGGEQQRVAIARALLKSPPILLADEPTASLDSAAGGAIGGILSGLANDEGRTVVVVSHDPRWEPFASRIVVLRDGEVIDDRRGT